MAKNKRVAFFIPQEQWQGLAALAGTSGVSAEEVIRRSLANDAVVGLFFQCRLYSPELRWEEVAEVGREAVREHLRAAYMKGLREHLARLGVTLESSAEEVEAARARALAELKADTAKPLDYQIAKAQEDSVYLGCLYEAWQRAQAGRSEYAIAEVEVQGGAAGPGKAWAVLKNHQIV